MNTNFGTNILYTSGKIFSGSVSASALGVGDSNDVYYSTVRADKVFLSAMDVDSVDFFEASSFTSFFKLKFTKQALTFTSLSLHMYWMVNGPEMRSAFAILVDTFFTLRCVST